MRSSILYHILYGRVQFNGIKMQDDNFIQIKTGLTEGEKVISGPYNTITNVLKDGDMVKVEEEKDEKEDKK